MLWPLRRKTQLKVKNEVNDGSDSQGKTRGKVKVKSR